MKKLKNEIDSLKDENDRLKKRLAFYENKQGINQEFLHTLINCIPNPLFVKNKSFKHILFNDSYMKILKLSYDEIINKTDFDLFREGHASKFRDEDISVLSNDEKLLIEEEIELDNEEIGTFLTSKVRISDNNNDPYILGLITDISEKKKYQSLLENKNQELKKEKQKVEVLLQEVNHRVKNNLQVLNSMLSLQLDEPISKQTKGIIKDFKHRVMAIADIHELLYQTEDLSQIPFNIYAERIITNLVRSCDYEHNIRLSLNLQKVIVNSSIAVPLGMVVNEIIMNSIKYSSSELGLEIYARMNVNESTCTLEIGDNGNLELNETTEFNISTGSELIELFCNQIEAKVERSIKEKGVHYLISFEI